MLYRVDFSLEPWRWVFPIIYKRIESFAVEFDNSIAQVQARMAALVTGQPDICLLVQADEGDISRITGHCLLLIQPYDSDTHVVLAEQIKVDSGHDSDFVESCIKYVETQLAPVLHITKIIMTAQERVYRAYRKKYGFKPYRVIMTYDLGQEE